MSSPVPALRIDLPAGLPALRSARFEALGARSPLSIQRAACLRLRTRGATCRACVDVCPTGALRAAEQRLEIGADCTGCGRCQAACPTGALTVDGFEVSQPPPPVGVEAVTIDCWQVPQTLPDRGEMRVPCLGGLSAGRLLALCASAPKRVLVLADRGGCGDCASGGGEHPARATLRHVVSLMAQAGLPETLRPRLVSMPMRGHFARRGEPMRAPGRSRRGFFSALVQPASAVPARDAGPPRTQPSVERALIIDALRTLVARHGGRMPAGLFHRLEVGAACRSHRVCAAACPTGALRRYRDDGTGRMGLAFDNAACIACGHCAAVCPEQALHLHQGQGEAALGRTPLTAFLQRECADCGSRFALREDEDETRCGRCRTSVQLARSAFQTLFGARP